MKEKPLIFVVLLLIPMAASFAFGLDLYIPLVPYIKKLFGASREEMQLTLSLYMLFCGIGQLIGGPFSDRYGRKKGAFFASLLFIGGSIFCAYSPTPRWLIFWRSLQAFGGSAMVVVAFSSLRELFDGKDVVRGVNILNGSIGLAPVFGPILGAYLLRMGTWQTPFFFAAFLGVLAFSLAFCVLPKKVIYKKEREILLYKKVLFSKGFYAYALGPMVSSSAFFLYVSISPFIFMTVLGQSLETFSFCFGTVGLFYVLSSYFNAFLAKSIGLLAAYVAGGLLLLFGSLALVTSYLFLGVTFLGFLFPSLLIMSGGSIMGSSGIAGALLPFKGESGKAAAFIGFLQYVGSAIIGDIASRFGVLSPLPMGVTVLLLGISALLVAIFYGRKESV